jgi:hypothetical protein
MNDDVKQTAAEKARQWLRVNWEPWEFKDNEIWRATGVITASFIAGFEAGFNECKSLSLEAIKQETYATNPDDMHYNCLKAVERVGDS